VALEKEEGGRLIKQTQSCQISFQIYELKEKVTNAEQIKA
jgi:hypothetical protein